MIRQRMIIIGTRAVWLQLGVSVILHLLNAFMLFVSSSVQAVDYSAYNKLQAAYIYKIASFVTWPADAHSSRFTICILEADESLSSGLRTAIAGRAIGQAPITVLSLTLNQLRQTPLQQHECKMVYLNQKAKQDDIASWSEHNSHVPVLWVSSPEVSAPPGVLFELELEAEKIVIYINKNELGSSQLVVAPPLLSVARPR